MSSVTEKAVAGAVAVRTAVAEKTEALGEVIRDRATQAKDYGQDAVDEMTNAVQERPWTSVAIAVAVGVGIGCLIGAAARR